MAPISNTRSNEPNRMSFLTVVISSKTRDLLRDFLEGSSGKHLYIVLKSQPTIFCGKEKKRKMESIISNAIILKQISFKDHDQIITFLTEDHGKHAGIVRGVKRSNSRYGLAFEPLRQISLCYRQKTNAVLVAVQRGELLNGFHRIHQSYPKILCGIYLSELIYLIDVATENSSEFFNWLLTGLLSLEETDDWRDVKLCWEWSFLERLGVLPELSQCVICQKPAINPNINPLEVSENESFFFKIDVSEGGLCCMKCQKSEKYLVSLSRGTLRSLQSQQMQTGILPLTPRVHQEWNRLFSAFFQFHVGRLPKSHAMVVS